MRFVFCFPLIILLHNFSSSLVFNSFCWFSVLSYHLSLLFLSSVPCLVSRLIFFSSFVSQFFFSFIYFLNVSPSLLFVTYFSCCHFICPQFIVLFIYWFSSLFVFTSSFPPLVCRVFSLFFYFSSFLLHVTNFSRCHVYFVSNLSRCPLSSFFYSSFVFRRSFLPAVCRVSIFLLFLFLSLSFSFINFSCWHFPLFFNSSRCLLFSSICVTSIFIYLFFTFFSLCCFHFCFAFLFSLRWICFFLFSDFLVFIFFGVFMDVSHYIGVLVITIVFFVSIIFIHFLFSLVSFYICLELVLFISFK